MNMCAQRARMKGAYLFSVRRDIKADVNDHLVANGDCTNLRTEQAECLMQAKRAWIHENDARMHQMPAATIAQTQQTGPACSNIRHEKMQEGGDGRAGIFRIAKVVVERGADGVLSFLRAAHIVAQQGQARLSAGPLHFPPEVVLLLLLLLLLLLPLLSTPKNGGLRHLSPPLPPRQPFSIPPTFSVALFFLI